MHRTNIYLTEEQDRELRVRARAEGSTKSAVLRAILDRDLLGPSAEVEAGFAQLADRYEDLTAGLFEEESSSIPAP